MLIRILEMGEDKRYIGENNVIDGWSFLEGIWRWGDPETGEVFLWLPSSKSDFFSSSPILPIYELLACMIRRKLNGKYNSFKLAISFLWTFIFMRWILKCGLLVEFRVCLLWAVKLSHEVSCILTWFMGMCTF